MAAAPADQSPSPEIHSEEDLHAIEERLQFVSTKIDAILKVLEEATTDRAKIKLVQQLYQLEEEEQMLNHELVLKRRALRKRKIEAVLGADAERLSVHTHDASQPRPSVSLTPGHCLEVPRPSDAHLAGGSQTSSTSQSNSHSLIQTTSEAELFERLAANWEIDPSQIDWSTAKLLGAGQFGEVYRASYRGMEVAVKKLKPKFETPEQHQAFIEDFRKECAVMRKLIHPNTLLFLGAATDPTRDLLIVMELMPNGSVADVLHRHKKKSTSVKKIHLTVQQKVNFMRDTARGMAWLHTSTPVFIHLDLKPANLLIDKNWSVRVGDFGLTTMKKEGGGASVGTPAYMAPEIIRGKQYDEKADVFSFAICMWEIYTGEVPYEKNGPSNTLTLSFKVAEAGLRPLMPAPPGMPPVPGTEGMPPMPDALRQLIERCWDDNPANRPSFIDILQGNYFTQILIDAVFPLHNVLGRRMWVQNFGDVERVPWSKFRRVFLHFMNISEDTLVFAYKATEAPMRCLRWLLCTPSTMHSSTCTIDREDEGVVDIAAWAALLDWFGPLARGPDLLKRIVEVAKETWFFGDLPRKQANDLLTAQPTGSFLVRFAKSPEHPATPGEGAFYLSCVGRDETIRHFLVIAHVTSTGGVYSTQVKLDVDNSLLGRIEVATLPLLVKKYAKQLYLSYPCPGSPLQPLLTTRVRKVEDHPTL